MLKINLNANVKCFPRLLPKFCINADGFWDPEKYFDLMKLANTISNPSSKPNDRTDTSQYEDRDCGSINSCGDSIHIQSSVLGEENVKESKDEMIMREKVNGYHVLSLNPGDTYDITFCSFNYTNDFYVNLASMFKDLHEFSDFINKHCNAEHQEDQKAHYQTTKPKIGEILFAKSIIDGIWYRARVIATSGN